jgi:voltage-gated potassium channel Kch
MISSRPGLVGMIVGGLIFIKLFILLVLGRVFKMGVDQNILFAFSLAQGGEFAFVLFSFAVQNHVISDTIANPLIGAVALSMALTPLLLIINEKVLQPRIGTKVQEEKEADKIDEKNPVIIAGFGNFGSIVGRLLRANGIGITVLELDSDKVDLLRKLGLVVFYGDASRHELIHSAGAENAKIMVFELNEHPKVLQMVHMVKKYFPHLTLFARAAGRTEAYELLDAGVDHVYRETFDTSLRTGIDALRTLGFRSHQAHRATRTFRHHDEEALSALRHVRHDRKAYISHARQRIGDLEQLLLSELREPEEHLDAGWDTTSMIEEYGGKREKT